MEGDSRNPRVSLLKKYDIPIDHLSFEYIESCKDKKELERIVRILRSGEEGTYPDLVKTAENQLRQVAPESRVLRVETPALKKESFSSEEWKTVENDLLSWEEEMNVMDKSLEFEKKRFDTIGNKNLPEVRKTVEKKPENKMKQETEIKKIKVETNIKNERIRSGDYAAWEKFDVDKELLKLDLEEERNQEKNAKLKRVTEKAKKKVEEKKIEPISVDAESYSNMEQQILANQAKDRGNECFKSGDFDGALKYYNVSLKLCPTANAYNNRAMTYIKIKSYEEALKDCNEVLKREENNVKALHRRATAYQNLPKENYNELALADLLKIISLEPTNRVAQNDLQALKKKLNIQDIGKKFRMMIEESGNSQIKEFFSKSNAPAKNIWNDSDNIAVHKLPLTYYGPSTSTFQCEPQSMTHRMLSGPTFSGQVMCKCNSNATRQNPLCHRCGERLSRPKQKPKITATPTIANQSQGKSEVNAVNEGIKESKLREMKEELKQEKILNSVINEKSQVSGGAISSQGENEVKSKSALNEENEKSKLAIAEENVKDEISNNNEKDKEIKTIIDSASNEKLDKGDSCEVGSDANGNVVENVVSDKGVGADGLNNNMINEVKDSERNIDVNSKEDEAPVSEAAEIDGTIKLFEELDLSMKERKNLDNEQCKDLTLQSASDDGVAICKEGIPNNCEIRNEKSNDNVANKSNEGSGEKNVTGSENRCLPSTSSQKEIKSETKKSRSKKKKAKEPRQDGIRLRYTEPVKIVQATKYLKPTSAEPKPETGSCKEAQRDATADPKCQFKSFVPSKKCVSSESGVLTSTAVSHSSNVKDKDYRATPQLYDANSIERIARHCEGNKENILENRNDFKSFEKLKSCYPEDNESATLLGSSFEFMKSWESMKKTDESYEKRAEIIRLIRPEDLKTVIGNNLDSDMLKSLLECLEKHFLDDDPKKVISILKELPRIPRFGIVNLFLDKNDRKVIDRLIENAEKKGFVVEEEVKNSLKISF